jgi:hypothetical protein
MTETLLVTVVAASGSGACCVDVAVASEVGLAELLPDLLAACALEPTGPWSVRDGERELRLHGPGLAEQGVVSGSVLRLERRPSRL